MSAKMIKLNKDIIKGTPIERPVRYVYEKFFTRNLLKRRI